MVKIVHEIRDPVHTFIHIDQDERVAVDSPPVQRLRQIHQLALSYLVYPGATHRRFEHSLGVMELAGRVFDVVTNPDNVHPAVRALFPELSNPDARAYWRRVIRIAALCHDLGHLPFSHAAEHELLPDGWTHERLSLELIRSPLMEPIWASATPPLRSLDIAKLAVGQKYLPDESFSDWEAVLSEIIVGNAFGVDRIDYLLRDSLHAGVAYGRFDHYRLIDTIRILLPETAEGEQGSIEPQLGIEEGGLRTAESLLLARYFMFSQVYLHPVRRIYDIHLRDFLAEWLTGGKFSVQLDDHISLTDTEVTAAMSRAVRNPEAAGHEPASRIMRRQHFKVLWSWNPGDIAVNLDAGRLIFLEAASEFGGQVVRRDAYSPKSAVVEFPVLERDGSIVSSSSVSDVLRNIPASKFEYVFIQPDLAVRARRWLAEKRNQLLSRVIEEEE